MTVLGLGYCLREPQAHRSDAAVVARQSMMLVGLLLVISLALAYFLVPKSDPQPVVIWCVAVMGSMPVLVPAWSLAVFPLARSAVAADRRLVKVHRWTALISQTLGATLIIAALGSCYAHPAGAIDKGQPTISPAAMSAGDLARADNEMIPLAIVGIDHLADHVSVQNFWVDGYSGGRAGKGGASVCCASVPKTWKPGLTAKIRWEVLNWRDWESDEYTAVVPVEKYGELDQLYVHFLANGSVRVVPSLEGPLSPTYPGPHDPIPRKKPWDVYEDKHKPTKCTDHSTQPPVPCSD